MKWDQFMFMLNEEGCFKKTNNWGDVLYFFLTKRGNVIGFQEIHGKLYFAFCKKGDDGIVILFPSKLSHYYKKRYYDPMKMEQLL